MTPCESPFPPFGVMLSSPLGRGRHASIGANAAASLRRSRRSVWNDNDMLIFNDIVGAVRTAKNVQKFVEGELAIILTSIADVEYRTAAEVLRKLTLARNKNAHVSLAVGHLQTAHTAYKNLHSNAGWRGYFTLTTQIAALHKDIFTLSLMAICYKYLEEHDLMTDAPRSASEAMSAWVGIREGYTLGELADRQKRKTVISAFGSWLNPGSWAMMTQIARDGFPDIKPVELEDLAACLARDSS